MTPEEATRLTKIEQQQELLTPLIPGVNILQGQDGSFSNIPTAPGGGLPAGGTTNQILVKASNADYDVTWKSLTEFTLASYTGG